MEAELTDLEFGDSRMIIAERESKIIKSFSLMSLLGRLTIVFPIMLVFFVMLIFSGLLYPDVNRGTRVKLVNLSKDIRDIFYSIISFFRNINQYQN